MKLKIKTYRKRLMKLPPTTSQQEEIINLTFQFRYLLVRQFMILLNHKDPRRIREWLTDLVSKKYLAKIINEEISKGYIYCLDQKAGHILKKDESISSDVLGRIYKEKTREAPFIKRHIFIADIFLYFLSRKHKNEELNFFTARELKSYGYFPDPRPSAYIETIEGKEVNRYFLEYFDNYSIHRVVRNRLQYYLNYCQSGDWEANATDAPIPTLLFVLPTEKFKKHIQIYARAVFEKNISEDIDFFLATEGAFKANKVEWLKV